MTYYTVEWQTTGPHGASSSGHIGRYVSAAEAVAAAAREAAAFADAARRHPLADTQFTPVAVTVDGYGNSEITAADTAAGGAQ